ncbi:MAG: hypothetical protein ACLU9Q_13440 [Marvinbryantia sp.]|uniref:hypothetical protein n=1 Tax=Marvinbryantia sp. TaxID=2496532 RepID=UPI00399B7BDA
MMRGKYFAMMMGMTLAAASVTAQAEAAANMSRGITAAAASVKEQTTESTETADEETTDGEEPPEKPDGEAMSDGGQPSAKQDRETMSDGEQPPEKPDGETMSDGEEPPEKADGETMSDGGQPPEKPDGEAMGDGGAPGGQGDPGGMGQQGVESYDAVNTYEEAVTVSGETIESTGIDENAVHVTNGATVTLDNVTVNRTSADSTGGDNSSFYGVGAAILATDGTAVVKNSSITTDAAGGAGVFAYGDGVTYVEDTTIETQQDTSGGLHVAGGGTLYAWDVTAVTNGGSAAAVRSDRGGGTMVIDGGSYTSNGFGSPAVYCTADISINNAQLTATGSEAVCIEGLNTLRLYDSELSGSMIDDDQNDNTWTVIVYQSMSGDSEVGNGTFQMTGGSLTSGNGGIFYTTNTESTITLEDVEINYADDSEFFLQCTGNSNARGWGNAGDNGADCLFTGIAQQMQGDVIWDSISELDFYMTGGSVLAGAIVQDETWAGEGGDGYCNVVVSDDSEWIVTGDSRVSALSAGGSIIDETGATVTIQGADGTVYVEGDSAYTITVDSYSDTADTSAAGTVDGWEAHAAERV